MISSRKGYASSRKPSGAASSYKPKAKSAKRSVAGQLTKYGGKKFLEYALSGVPGGPILRDVLSTAASKAIRAVRGRSQSKEQQQKKSAGYSKWAGASKGYYKGLFKKTSKNPWNAEAKALSNGYHCTQEAFGRVEDPNCVYLMHSTVNLPQMARVIDGAMLRKLFAKAGLPLKSKDIELPLFSQDNSDGFKIQVVVNGELDGGIGVYEYITINNQTLNDVLDAFTALSGHTLGYLRGTETNPITAIHLFASDRNGLDTNWRQLSTIYVRDMIFDIQCTSSLKIQNRSAGSNASGAAQYELDRIDSQPLMGKRYLFKNGEPKLGYLASVNLGVSNVHFNNIAEYGVTLFRSADTVVPAYQEPPNARFWANCTQCSSVQLQPGDIKRGTITYGYSGKLFALSMKLRAQKYASLSGVPTVSGTWGRCEGYALEELLRTPSANPITVSYEREYKVGCTIRQGKLPSFTTQMSSFELNKLPA